MKTTSVHLDQRQVEALRRISEQTGRFMADLIRTAIDEWKVRHDLRARPRIGLYGSGKRDTAQRDESILAERGFGEDR